MQKKKKRGNPNQSLTGIADPDDESCMLCRYGNRLDGIAMAHEIRNLLSVKCGCKTGQKTCPFSTIYKQIYIARIQDFHLH